jgi:purine-binding chemotaxis protein CheW
VINLGTPLGFVVDRVASVIAVDDSQIEPASNIGSSINQNLVTGVIKGANGQVIMVLDFARLIETEFAEIGNATRGHAFAGAETSASSTDDEEDQVVDELQLVSFSVAGQEYAADIAAVREIVQVPARIAKVPNAPSHVLGMMTLRERLLPLVSLRIMLGLQAMELEDSHRIVVLGLGADRAVGIVADTVDEVLRVPREQVETFPAILARNGVDEISSVCRLNSGARLVSVLDTARMFENADLKAAFAQASQLGEDMEDTLQRGEDAEDILEDDEQVVVFRLGSEEFGVSIATVQEIVRVPEQLTHVPKAPHFVEGVINLRGAVLPVIDQRRRLGLAALERNERQRIMVYALNGKRTGFIVDAVSEVLKIPRHAIEASPPLSGEQQRLLGRVANLEKQKRMIMLLDPTSLLSDTELATIDTIA